MNIQIFGKSKSWSYRFFFYNNPHTSSVFSAISTIKLINIMYDSDFFCHDLRLLFRYFRQI